MSQEIVKAMAELNEDTLEQKIKEAIGAATPVESILADLQAGMDEIGRRFETKEYFLSELIMSAEIFKETVAGLGSSEAENKNKLGTFLIGTVFGDIHDIGKNIVASVMSSNGFRVVDIGVDVSAEAFVKSVKEEQPEIIGLSCLLTTAFDSMKTVIEALRAENLLDGRLLLIGGGPVDKHTVTYVGADDYCESAQDGVKKAQAYLEAR